MSHYLTQCPLTVDIGLEIKYPDEYDKCCSNYEEKKIKIVKNSTNDGKDKKSVCHTNSDPVDGCVKKSNDGGYYSAARIKSFTEKNGEEESL